MSMEGASYSFIPAVRFSVCTDKPDNIRVKAAALALFAENCNILLLAGKNPPDGELRTSALWWNNIRQNITAIIRPDDLPESPWYSGNLALPLLQQAGAIWQMVVDRGLSVAATPAIQECLKHHFLTTQDRYLSRSSGLEILSKNGFLTLFTTTASLLGCTHRYWQSMGQSTAPVAGLAR